MSEERDALERLRSAVGSRVSTWVYGQTIYETGRNDALTWVQQEIDDILYELDGGEYEEDPKPWVYRDGTRQKYGPGHDSIYGWSEYSPRKIRKVADSPEIG